VILPCRNEEKNIEKTLKFLQNQTIKPNEVVIADDASTDNTFEIIRKFAKENEWTVVHREKNDERYLSIVNTMKIASRNLRKDFDYLMVLDSDTLLEPEYFEKILNKFKINTNLGITSGNIRPADGNILVGFLKNPNNVFGSSRVYSRSCWYAINEGKEMKANSVAWDTEHTIIAGSHGYLVKRFDDILSKSVRSASSELSSFRRGEIFYQFVYGFLSTFIDSILKLKSGYFFGYLKARAQKQKQIGNKDMLKKIKHENDKKAYRRLYNIFSK